MIFATDEWLSRLGRYPSGLNGLVGSKSRIHQIIYVGEKTLRIFNFFKRALLEIGEPRAEAATSPIGWESHDPQR
jgi:oxalate decarboxylase/phosphoglucose isomerase-like protein (cupin superfamily)